MAFALQVYGNTIIDKATQCAIVGGRRTYLSPKEYMMFMLLVDLAGKPLQPDDEARRETAVYLCRVRKKLRTIESNIGIKKIRSAGYFLFVE